MRADVLLNKLCLAKTRSAVKKGFDSGAIKINGKIAKASKDIAIGDVVEISFRTKLLEVKINQLPSGNVSKKQAQEYYDVLREEKIDEADGLE